MSRALFLWMAAGVTEKPYLGARVWGSGSNSQCQLGIGSAVPNKVSSLTQGPGSDKWASASSSSSFSLLVSDDGKLWYWGSIPNIGPTQCQPALLDGSSIWGLESFASDQSVFAIKSDRTLWVAGNNLFGILGVGDDDDRYELVEVSGGGLWSIVRNSSINSVGIKEDGTLWAWGGNFDGQLGQGDTSARYSPTQVGTDADWVSADTYNYLAAVKDNGTLWMCGGNQWGQLGQGDTISRSSLVQVGTDTDWVEVRTAGGGVIALKSNGEMYSWGRNHRGQLGLGDTAERGAPTQIGLRDDWAKIAAQGPSAAAITEGRELFTWGANSTGALATGDEIDQLLPFNASDGKFWFDVSVTSSTLLAREDDSIPPPPPPVQWVPVLTAPPQNDVTDHITWSVALPGGGIYAGNQSISLFVPGGPPAWIPIVSGNGGNGWDAVLLDSAVYITRDAGLYRHIPGGSTETLVAPFGGPTQQLRSLVVFNGEIYGVRYTIGSVYKWDGVSSLSFVGRAGGPPVPPYEVHNGVLAVHNGKLYLSGSRDSSFTGGGALWEWDGASSFVEVAPELEATYGATEDMISHNGSLFAINKRGRLLRWNETDSWDVAAEPVEEAIPGFANNNSKMISFDGSIYLTGLDGSSPSSNALLRWSEIYGRLDVVVLSGDIAIGASQISSLAVLNGELYATTSSLPNPGYLLKLPS